MKIRMLCAGLLALACWSAAPFAADTHDHGHEGAAASPKEGHEAGHEGEAEEENRVHLNEAQRAAAGIRVEAVAPAPLPEEIDAPGEIRADGYASSQVTPRIAAQVVQRQARLGDRVTAGQPLATLSSVEMAEAQGALLVAAREWQMVNKLGREAVAERRFVEAQVAFRQAQSRLAAYGMGAAQVERLAKGEGNGSADGQFTLTAPQAGTVIRDDFVLGQRMNPGDLLFELTDESTLWVEARVGAEAASRIAPGAAARVQAGTAWSDARVIHLRHALDETTRTLGVRLGLANTGDRLHPGQFVRVRIQVGQSAEAVLALPQEAVLRSPDGDWQVLVEEAPGEFAPQEVEVVRQLPGRVVVEGLKEGTRVVTQGAFFVQSELAKAGFDVHNH